MKTEYTEKIDKLLAKLSGFSQNQVDIDGLLSSGIKSLINLENLYAEGDIVKKREIIGSIYPGKLTFDGFSYRTARLNEAVRLIYSLGAGFSGQKNRTSPKKIDLSCFVTPTIQFSNLFLMDLKRLANLAI